MNYKGQTLSTANDVAEDIRRKHSDILRSIEVALGQRWRIITLRESSSSIYDATLKTQQAEHPVYAIAGIDNSYHFTAIEDGPRETRVETQGRIETIPISRAHLQGTAKLLSDGRLRITECRVETPR